MRYKRPKSLSERRAEFIADLAAQDSKVIPQKRRKLKSVSLEKMADLYLAKLASEKNGGVFLNEVLNRHGIYYTIDSIQQCLDLLLEKNILCLLHLASQLSRFPRPQVFGHAVLQSHGRSPSTKSQMQG
jgi:hypothetical protein